MRPKHSAKKTPRAKSRGAGGETTKAHLRVNIYNLNAAVGDGPHNNACEYCDEGGELVCCFSCNISAHRTCADEAADSDTAHTVRHNGEDWWICGDCHADHYGN